MNRAALAGVRVAALLAEVAVLAVFVHFQAVREFFDAFVTDEFVFLVAAATKKRGEGVLVAAVNGNGAFGPHKSEALVALQTIFPVLFEARATGDRPENADHVVPVALGLNARQTVVGQALAADVPDSVGAIAMLVGNRGAAFAVVGRVKEGFADLAKGVIAFQLFAVGDAKKAGVRAGRPIFGFTLGAEEGGGRVVLAEGHGRHAEAVVEFEVIVARGTDVGVGGVGQTFVDLLGDALLAVGGGGGDHVGGGEAGEALVDDSAGGLAILGGNWRANHIGSREIIFGIALEAGGTGVGVFGALIDVEVAGVVIGFGVVGEALGTTKGVFNEDFATEHFLRDAKSRNWVGIVIGFALLAGLLDATRFRTIRVVDGFTLRPSTL